MVGGAKPQGAKDRINPGLRLRVGFYGWRVEWKWGGVRSTSRKTKSTEQNIRSIGRSEGGSSQKRQKKYLVKLIAMMVENQA
jgi:hypothetical protein